MVIGREAERQRAFVMGNRLGGAAEPIAGPSELVGDLGDVRKTRVELLQQTEHVLDLSAVAGTDDGREFGFPGRHKLKATQRLICVAVGSSAQDQAVGAAPGAAGFTVFTARARVAISVLRRAR